MKRVPKIKLVKWVGRLDRGSRLLRICRIVWTKGELGKGGYDAKLSLGLRPALFNFRREFQAWLLTICGVRLHYRRSGSMGMC